MTERTLRDVRCPERDLLVLVCFAFERLIVEGYVPESASQVLEDIDIGRPEGAPKSWTPGEEHLAYARELIRDFPEYARRCKVVVPARTS